MRKRERLQICECRVNRIVSGWLDAAMTHLNAVILGLYTLSSRISIQWRNRPSNVFVALSRSGAGLQAPRLQRHSHGHWKSTARAAI